MANQGAINSIPMLEAGGDLSADQFKFVKMSTTDKRVTLAGNGEAAIGVLQNKPDAAGKAAAVYGDGTVTKLEVGTGGLTAGDDVASDASGLGVVATTGERILARCIIGAAVGERATVYLQTAGRVA